LCFHGHQRLPSAACHLDERERGVGPNPETMGGNRCSRWREGRVQTSTFLRRLRDVPSNIGHPRNNTPRATPPRCRFRPRGNGNACGQLCRQTQLGSGWWRRGSDRQQPVLRWVQRGVSAKPSGTREPTQHISLCRHPRLPMHTNLGSELSKQRRLITSDRSAFSVWHHRLTLLRVTCILEPERYDMRC
jgi:hypothetical protein